MNICFLDGAQDFAPIFLPAIGEEPTWSGKSIFELSKAEIEAISMFCMDAAFEMGMEDYVEGRRETKNPFHPRFLNGVPHSIYATYYRRGRGEASGERVLPGMCGYGLFAAI